MWEQDSPSSKNRSQGVSQSCLGRLARLISLLNSDAAMLLNTRWLPVLLESLLNLQHA